MRVHHNVPLPRPNTPPQPRKAADAGDEQSKFARVSAPSEQRRHGGAKPQYRRRDADNQQEPDFEAEDDAWTSNESDPVATVSLIGIDESQTDRSLQNKDGSGDVIQPSRAPVQSNDALWDLFSKAAERQ